MSLRDSGCTALHTASTKNQHEVSIKFLRPFDTARTVPPPAGPVRTSSLPCHQAQLPAPPSHRHWSQATWIRALAPRLSQWLHRPQVHHTIAMASRRGALLSRLRVLCCCCVGPPPARRGPCRRRDHGITGIMPRHCRPGRVLVRVTSHTRSTHCHHPKHTAT
jgi:hypothetical protein